jgi:hypothetical protein
MKTLILIQAALETVRCEELQLELSAALKSRSGRPSDLQTSTANAASKSYGSTTNNLSGVMTSSSGISNIVPTDIRLSSNTSDNYIGVGSSSTGIVRASGSGSGGTVTWAPTPLQQKGSEIDRIMAKIEQARLSIANVCVLIKKEKIN